VTIDRFGVDRQELRNPRRWCNLLASYACNPKNQPLHEDLYKLWDLHIQRDTALVFAARSRLKTFAAARATRFLPLSGQRQNESAPDPGLSLGTPVEQPSPRTAQTQPRFLPDRRKWPRSASRRHHRATNASEQSQNRPSGGQVDVEGAAEARSLPEGGRTFLRSRLHISQHLACGASRHDHSQIVSPPGIPEVKDRLKSVYRR